MRKSLAALLLSFCSFAGADILQNDQEFRFFAPATNWWVTMPKGDWVMEKEQKRPDGTGFYYLLSSKSRALNFSIYLDKTTKCNSSAGCRDMFWRNPGPMYKGAKAVEQYEKNGFHVIQFQVENPGGFPVKQANISAHAYKDGYWIDVHISKVDKDMPDVAPLVAALQAVSFK